MSLATCLDSAVAGEEISRRDAERLKARFEDFRKRHADGAEATADYQARQDLIDELKADTAHKKRKAKLALKKLREIEMNLAGYRDARGEADISAAVLDMLEHFGTAKFASVAGRERALQGMAHAKMETFLNHFRRGALAGDKARWNVADMRNVMRELFGEDSGDQAAKGLAKAWTETAEWLRQRFNSAGGAIGKLENWGAPQHHDARALRNVGPEKWKETIRPMLDLGRMTHPLTGKAITAREIDGILDEIWQTVATDGWSKREPSRQPFGRGSLANQRAEHRFLVFRSADDWLSYQEMFGGGDAFAAMMGHINMMARDIAAMEILGPNPEGTMNWLRQAIQKEAASKAAGGRGRIPGEGSDATDRAKTMTKRINDVWASIRGAANTPVSTKWANRMGVVRNLITASVLGQAAISSVSDLGTAMIARKFAGLPAASTIKEAISATIPSTRREAVAAGLILDSAAHVMHTQARYVGTLGGPAWSQYLADRVLTYSGLTPWTQAGKHAFGLSFQYEAAKLVGKSYADLPDAFRNTFARYGISELDWKMMQNAKLHQTGRGVAMLRPAEIAEAGGDALAMRYLEMIQAETEFAIPSGSHRSRTALISDVQPGTFIGEVARSLSQFKSFGTVFLLLHGARIHRMIAGGDKTGAAGYAGSLLLTTTIFGAAAIQLKQVANGRDPRDMDTASFWTAASLQGGGFGIYGDFLFADINRYGGGMATTIAGPAVGKINDFRNLTAGNLVQLASGEKTHFGRELVKFAKGSIPGGNIWYLKLAFERNVLDQLQTVVDPEAQKAFKRQQQYWRRNFGQEFWWAPGETQPRRGPDLSLANNR
ncbi:hypothetical protein [Jiella avicenniae]|uniref:Uncharacterized protein n=1 Tax=Jiella avicenniae TaxID=2907202 RepID=A0A9X1NVG2_9HYPH|nr:hypothetical protein [Jiella avicenniae]MCE7026430.1 hypothetical protein [Jiella avicenniae]